MNNNRIISRNIICLICCFFLISCNNSLLKKENIKQYGDKNDNILNDKVTTSEKASGLYKNDLYIDDTNNKFASNVIASAVYKSDIYYSTEEGLFVYDTNENSSKKIISTETRTSNGNSLLTIQMIKASESGLDLIVYRHSWVGAFMLHFKANLDGSNFRTYSIRPKLIINTFLVDDQGYFIKYPTEFCADLEYGSYYSGGIQLYHETKDIFMYVFNEAYFYDKPDVEEFKKQFDTTEIKTEKGFNAYYYIEELNDETPEGLVNESYHLSCVTENGFRINVRFKDKNTLDYVEKVFIEIVKSIHKYEDIRYDDAE